MLAPRVQALGRPTPTKHSLCVRPTPGQRCENEQQKLSTFAEPSCRQRPPLRKEIGVAHSWVGRKFCRPDEVAAVASQQY